GLRGESGVGEESVMKQLAPAKFGVHAAASGSRLRAPVLADSGIGRGVRVFEQRLNDFVSGMAAVERVDHGLNDGNGAVIGTAIGPGFEIMHPVDVPMGFKAGFVAVIAKVNYRSDFVEGGGELQVGGRVVDRVGVEDDQPVHFARVHVGYQRLEVIVLNGRHGVDCVGVDHGLAHVAERVVDGNGSQVDAGRLLLTGNDDALAGVGLQILD